MKTVEEGKAFAAGISKREQEWAGLAYTWVRRQDIELGYSGGWEDGVAWARKNQQQKRKATR